MLAQYKYEGMLNFTLYIVHNLADVNLCVGKLFFTETKLLGQSLALITTSFG